MATNLHASRVAEVTTDEDALYTPSETKTKPLVEEQPLYSSAQSQPHEELASLLHQTLWNPAFHAAGTSPGLHGLSWLPH